MTIAVTGARLLTPGGERQNVTVVMDAGRFVTVGEGLAAPAGAEVVEVNGATATCGLMAGASRIGIAGWSGDEAPAESSLDVAAMVDPNHPLVGVARADGLARAIAVPDGTGAVLGWAAGLRFGEGLGIVEEARAAWAGKIARPREAPSEAGRATAWRAIEAALEADTSALLALWAARASDVRRAVAVARGAGRRLVILGGAEAWRAADLLAAEGVGVALNPFDGLPGSADELFARDDAAAILVKAGVTIGYVAWATPAGHNPGTAIREAAGSAIAHGLAPDAALAALTTGPAAMFGIANRWGRVAEGYEADLVLWDGDPFEPGSRPWAMFVHGRAVSLVTRQDLLARRYHPARATEAWPPAWR